MDQQRIIIPDPEREEELIKRGILVDWADQYGHLAYSTPGFKLPFTKEQFDEMKKKGIIEDWFDVYGKEYGF